MVVGRCRWRLQQYGTHSVMPDAKVETNLKTAQLVPETTRWTGVDILLLSTLTIVALGLRLLLIEQWSFGVVEVETFRAVTQPMDAGAAGFFASDQSRYPLAFLLLSWLLDIGALEGFTEGWLRLPFACAGCLLVPVIAVFGRPLIGRFGACIAALLIAVHPSHIAASQSADPLVFALTLGVAAGAALIGGLRVISLVLLLLAGGCHPVGWLCGIGMLFAASPEARLAKISRWAWLVLLVSALVTVPCLLEVIGLPMLLLAAIASFLRLPAAGGARVLGLVLAALVPLVFGGSWWWMYPDDLSGFAVAALPAVALLSAWALGRFYVRLRDQLLRDQEHPRLSVWLLGLAPTLILLGELASITFLYFTAFHGSRPPWRDLCDEVLRLRTPGHQVEVIAGRGADVFRAYLRPSHWRQPDIGAGPANDPHPGVRVFDLPDGLPKLRELMALPDALLAVECDEWRELLQRDGAGELVRDCMIIETLPGAKASGDQSLYLLRNRRR